MSKPDGPVFDSTWREFCCVAPATRAQTDEMIKSHYLKKWPGVCTLKLALWLDGTPIGVIVFALPPRETSKRYGRVTWELARLWIADDVPQNAETFLISRAIRYIRKHHRNVKMLVTYADPSVGHSGVIYRAANFKDDGRTDQERKTPRFDYACAKTGKKYGRRNHIPEGVEIVRVPRVSKSRFTFAL